MEKLNLNKSDETNQNNQLLESPLTDKYDSAESQQASDQSDQENVKTVDKNKLTIENNVEKQSSNDLHSKIVNLSIQGHDNSLLSTNSNQINESTNLTKENGNLKNKKTTSEQIKLNQVQGRKSDNEILVAQTKKRITQKFEELEKKTGVKLKKSDFLQLKSQERLSNNELINADSSLKANSHSSPDELEYANSNDSESVSSFEIKHQTMSAEKIKEQAAIRLEFELKKAQKELKLRDEEIAKLSNIRREVEMELEDLTASLFEEANKMVQEAKHQKSKSDKALKEATMKNDVLLAEVKALKILVRNSIPCSIGTSSHSRQGSFKSAKSTSSAIQMNNNSLESIKNQFTPKLIKSPKNSIRALFINRTSIPFHSKTSKTSISKLLKPEKRFLQERFCKKSPSNYELASEMSKYLNEQQSEESSKLEQVKEETSQLCTSNDLKKIGEIDPIYYEEFLEWKSNSVLNKEGRFMKRIYEEEIETTMNFKNKDLTNQVLEAIKQNNIIIELNPDKSIFQRKCSLLDIPRICNYRMKINDEWYNISQLCRDRTSACCDLFCYLRYIQQGLVKSGLTEVYWEITRRRRNLILSKLGLSIL